MRNFKGIVFAVLVSIFSVVLGQERVLTLYYYKGSSMPKMAHLEEGYRKGDLLGPSIMGGRKDTFSAWDLGVIGADIYESFNLQAGRKVLDESVWFPGWAYGYSVYKRQHWMSDRWFVEYVMKFADWDNYYFSACPVTTLMWVFKDEPELNKVWWNTTAEQRFGLLMSGQWTIEYVQLKAK